MNLETDSDNMADVSWLVDSNWEAETDSLVESKVLKEMDSDSELLCD